MYVPKQNKFPAKESFLIVDLGANTGMTAPIFAKNEGMAQGLATMHPFRGLGEPEDIARAILFLASEDNSWMTGAMMPVDGGYTAQ